MLHINVQLYATAHLTVRTGCHVRAFGWTEFAYVITEPEVADLFLAQVM